MGGILYSLGKAAGWVEDKVTDLYHDVTGSPTAAEKRAQQNAINEQIKAYKDQTEMTRQALAEKQNEESVEKRRVEEKQIRSLRRNYRAAGSGFLGGQASGQNDLTNKLGG